MHKQLLLLLSIAPAAILLLLFSTLLFNIVEGEARILLLVGGSILALVALFKRKP
jgi:hypothetical protein